MRKKQLINWKGKYKMEIIRASKRCENKKLLYRLTCGVDTQKVINLKGQQVTVNDWVIYNKDDKRILSFLLSDGSVHATISPTFIDSFNIILEHVDDLDSFDIYVNASVSKSGREFIEAIWV